MSDADRRSKLSLAATVSLGTGVMIGAGIFALTGQVAESSGALYPLAFVLAAVVSAFSAHGYIRVASHKPSSGGIAMILVEAYGRGAVAASASMLMAVSMVLNESLVARTFATYALQPFGIDDGPLVPVLAIGLLALVLAINVAGNRAVSATARVSAALKIGGILVFAAAALWAGDFGYRPELGDGPDGGLAGLVAGTALAVLAFKGFTTITNSGGEVVDPGRNLGRAISWSLAICLVVYLAVCFGVGATLEVDAIVAARDYALAEAARPLLGGHGLWFTVAIAIIATASGLLASTFAVSRMLAMLTEMKLIPHRHFGMPGDVQDHTLVYTVVLAGVLAAFFDLSRIAALGAICYLVMDAVVHWGVFRHLRRRVGARAWVLLGAVALDALMLAALGWLKLRQDPAVLAWAAGTIALVVGFQAWYLRNDRGR